VTGALALHVAACQAVEFVVDDGSQSLERALVSVAPGAEELAYVAGLFPSLHPLSAELYRRARSPQITAPCMIVSWRILRLPEQRNI
jgi:hypothetical protein